MKLIIFIISLFFVFSTIVYADPLTERGGEIRSGIGSGDISGVIKAGEYVNNSVQFINNFSSVDAKNKANTTLDINTNQSVSGSVNISLYSENPTGASFGAIAINKYVDIIVSPNIAGSLQWAIIKIYYTDAEVSSVIESLLRIYWFNGTDWVPFNPPDGGVNTTENYVWANVTHFSVYGVFLSPPYCGDNVCYGGESCSSCTQDCGSCPSDVTTTGGGGGGGGGGGNEPVVCKINGICDPGETTEACPSDCKTETTTTSPTQTTIAQPTKETTQTTVTTTTTTTNVGPLTGYFAFFNQSNINIIGSVVAVLIGIVVILWIRKGSIEKKMKQFTTTHGGSKTI